jgi:hypothetical protein
MNAVETIVYYAKIARVLNILLLTAASALCAVLVGQTALSTTSLYSGPHENALADPRFRYLQLTVMLLFYIIIGLSIALNIMLSVIRQNFEILQGKYPDSDDVARLMTKFNAFSGAIVFLGAGALFVSVDYMLMYTQNIYKVNSTRNPVSQETDSSEYIKIMVKLAVFLIGFFCIAIIAAGGLSQSILNDLARSPTLALAVSIAAAAEKEAAAAEKEAADPDEILD